MMNLIVFGPIGTDAGYWYLGSDGKWHHVGGWAVEQVAEVSAAMRILSQATQLKTPGLTDSVTRSLTEFVSKQLETHLGDQLKGGGAVIINAG